MQSLSAADAGNRQDATKTDDGIDIGTAHSSTPDLHRDDPRSAEQIANRSPNDKLVKYVNSALQRKPPEYVGYAVNADSDVDARRPSTKPNKYLTTISIGTGDATRRKTNDSKLPDDGGLHGYGWTADEDRVWRAASRVFVDFAIDLPWRNKVPEGTALVFDDVRTSLQRSVG